jgi:hypothetical protein
MLWTCRYLHGIRPDAVIQAMKAIQEKDGAEMTAIGRSYSRPLTPK